MHREKSAKMAKWLFFCQIAILALFSLCINFKIFFSQMTCHWVLWKTYYTLFLKKCLWPCPGPSMYLSERINWIISSFPHRISKILFVLGSWDHFGSLGCGIGECPFFCCLTTWKKHCATHFGALIWISDIMKMLIVYFHLSNKRRGWNKRGGWTKSSNQ